MVSNIIFDFDGTIANTEHIFLESINKYAKTFGYPRTSVETLDQLKNNALADLIKLYKINFIKLPFLARAVLIDMSKRLTEAKLFPGIKDCLLELKAQGKDIYILSSNSKGNINKFFKNENLEIFKDVYTSFNLFGKAAKIKALTKKYKISIDSCIYVGDEVRDIVACKEAGLKIISVDWGFNSNQLLNTYNPDYLISNPSEIIKIVNS